MVQFIAEHAEWIAYPALIVFGVCALLIFRY